MQSLKRQKNATARTATANGNAVAESTTTGVDEKVDNLFVNTILDSYMDDDLMNA